MTHDAPINIARPCHELLRQMDESLSLKIHHLTYRPLILAFARRLRSATDALETGFNARPAIGTLIDHNGFLKHWNLLSFGLQVMR